MTLRAPRTAILFLLCAALGGCEFDIFGPGFDLGGGGGSYGGYGGSSGPPPDPELMVVGEVRVDGYPVAWEEAFVEVYAPEDTLAPIPTTFVVEDNGRWVTRSGPQAPVRWGMYELNFGSADDSAVCTYLVRVVLWTGARSELAPLVPDPPAGCDAGWGHLQGSSFELPGYGSDEEHWVEGTVYVDGALADQGGAGVELSVRQRADEPPVFTTTDADGSFRAMLDGPQWFVLCRTGLGARFRAGSYEEWVDLSGVPDVESCGAGRRLPDVRLGQILAAQGEIRVGGNLVGEGEGWARLLDPSDSTVVGDTVWTQDAGGYRLYFPMELEEPGCDWLIEGGVTDGPSEIRPYQRFDYCSDREWHTFELPVG